MERDRERAKTRTRVRNEEKSAKDGETERTIGQNVVVRRE